MGTGGRTAAITVVGWGERGLSTPCPYFSTSAKRVPHFGPFEWRQLLLDCLLINTENNQSVLVTEWGSSGLKHKLGLSIDQPKLQENAKWQVYTWLSPRCFFSTSSHQVAMSHYPRYNSPKEPLFLIPNTQVYTICNLSLVGLSQPCQPIWRQGCRGLSNSWVLAS